MYMLDKIIEANESTSNKLYVMYDIACSLQGHLKVREICVIFILIIGFIISHHIGGLYWKKLLCVCPHSIPLATKYLVR